MSWDEHIPPPTEDKELARASNAFREGLKAKLWILAIIVIVIIAIAISN